ncbi:MAG: 3-dehydroquinate synthase [Ruminococcus sp.]|nr:3-dehydroquinate synthase [Ruminococcus sp.]
MNMITVHASRVYPIWIGRGLLKQCGSLLREQTKAKTAAIVTDDNVDRLYGTSVVASLVQNGFRVVKFVFLHGESAKCSKTLNQIYDFLCAHEITRTDCLVALGGGVVGDITGFAAATFLRGLDYFQIPTTLLAQVDSSVGGKTAIDLPSGKNLVGAFKQPVAVLCDPDTLQTLPEIFLADGMGEVIKYGEIQDAKLFEQLEQYKLDTIHEVLEQVITTCIDIKRRVVEEDEFDTGLRMILNFGHTLGHAIESYYHYETYTHGSAVAAGMCMMAKKTCTSELYERLCHCVLSYHLPTEVPAKLEALLPLCGKDKKRANDTLRFIVCEEIGDAQIRSMTFEAFQNWMLS